MEPLTNSDFWFKEFRSPRFLALTGEQLVELFRDDDPRIEPDVTARISRRIMDLAWSIASPLADLPPQAAFAARRYWAGPGSLARRAKRPGHVTELQTRFVLKLFEAIQDPEGKYHERAVVDFGEVALAVMKLARQSLRSAKREGKHRLRNTDPDRKNEKSRVYRRTEFPTDPGVLQELSDQRQSGEVGSPSLEEAAIAMSVAHSNAKDAVDLRILELMRRGMSVADIAADVGCDPKTVMRRMVALAERMHPDLHKRKGRDGDGLLPMEAAE